MFKVKVALKELKGGEEKDLHAKIGELAAANNFLARKPKPWTGK